MPDVRPTFAHLGHLVDERGIWQHAVGTDPDPAHGYCLDDATRAAIVMARLAVSDPGWGRPLATCRRFIEAALTPDGLARNFMGADGSWLDGPHHGDHVGRAIWALAVLSADADAEQARWANDQFTRTIGAQPEHGPASLHSQIYALLGVAATDDADTVRAFGTELLDDVCARVSDTSAWPWPESSVRYDAGRIPEALIAAGRRLGHRRAVDAGLQLLDWLTALVAPRGRPHRYPGCHGLGPDTLLVDTGDEQPLEAAAFAAAHAAAATATGSTTHATHVHRALAWFHGDNRLRAPLVDDHEGACHDGLGRWTRNDNCGAESTIAYVEAWLHARDQVDPRAHGRWSGRLASGPAAIAARAGHRPTADRSV